MKNAGNTQQHPIKRAGSQHVEGPLSELGKGEHRLDYICTEGV